jgi:SLT domain-containing protein
VAESITYDFISRGADKLAGDFRKTGDSAALAARGAKVLSDVIKDLGQKEDRTAAQSKILAAALRQTGDAEDRAAAKAVLADAAIRRLDDSMKAIKPVDVVVLTGKAQAKLDEFQAKAEKLKAKFPQFTVKINDLVAKAKLDLFAADAKAKLGDLEVKVKVDESALSRAKKALSGLKGNPGLVGPALALAPAAGSILGVAAGATIGLAGAAVAGAAALAAFGAVAKPVLSDALKASQAVNTAQNNYQATIAAGVPKAQAQLRLQTANASAQLTYNAALAGGANRAKALAAYHLALAKNQLAYNAATNAGVFNAKAYAAEQLAINKAYAELSPQQIALSKQLGNMAQAWQDLKAAETPVVAGALQPWLKSVTDLTGKLGPVIAGVAPFIQYLGTQFDRLINSAAFAKFRDFVAGSGSVAVGAAGNAIIDLLKAFITLLPQFAPLINQASAGMLSFAQNVLKWSQSKKASDDITRFMAWFHANGPVVGGLLVNIGLALKALAPGLTTGGLTELKLISGFFAFVAKLPPALAKPLAEVAGALLILNKLGVISVGVKIVGAAAKWLAGGLVELGGGAAAGAEMRAGIVSGGAAAGAEIRGAMATGGAAGGAEAGGAWAAAAKLSAPAIGATIGLAVTAQIAGFLAYKKFSDLFSSGVKGSTAVGQGGSSGQGASIGAVLAGTGTNVAAKLTADLVPANKLLTSLGFSQAAISQINKAILKPGSNLGKVDALIYSLGGTQADILAVNKLIVKPGSSSSNIDALLKRIGLTPPQIASVNKLNLKPGQDPVHVDAMLRKIGLTQPQIAAANRLILRPHSDTSPVARLQQAINSLHGKTVNVLLHAAGSGSIYFNESTGVGGSVKGGLKFLAGGGTGPGLAVVGEQGPELVSLPPGSRVYSHGQSKAMIPGIPGFAAGGYVPNLPGAENWIGGNEYSFGKAVEGNFAVRLIGQLKAAVKKAAAAAAAAAAGSVAYSRVAGVTQWEGTALRALAMLGLPAADLPTVMAQILTESGGNPNAINLTDINAQQGDPSRGLLQLIGTTFAAYRSRALSSNIYNPLANIYAGLHYAESRYGNPGWLGVLGHGHGYDQGGWLMPGATLAINNTGRPEQVIPAGHGGGGVHLHLTVNGPIGSQQQLEDWFVKTANHTARTGRLAQAVKTAAR